MLNRESDASLELHFNEDLPDLLFAIVETLADGDLSESRYAAVNRLYPLVCDIDWRGDEFCEKAQVLAQISRLAWSQSLKFGTALETRRWEQECLKSCLLQEDVQQLFGMPASSWSAAVCDRYLSDRTFLLALCEWLNSQGDVIPHPVFELASVAYGWLSAHPSQGATRAEESYLLALFSIILANASRTFGQYKKGGEWLRLAKEWCRSSSKQESLQARVEYIRLAILFATHHDALVLREVPRLIETFAGLGLEEDVAKSKYLHAMAQKEVVGGEQALQAFSLLSTEPAVMQQPWLKAIVVVNIAELQSQAGNLGAALCSIKEANALLQDAGKPFAQAHCSGAIAEILRDHGQLSAAVECYRRGVEIYLAVGMAALAAYARLLLAETLVATDRLDEALGEILAALPVIEREYLVREGIVAVELLKASMSRRKLDPDALRSLRESIDHARREAEL